AQRGKNQAYDRFLAGFDLTAVHEGTARLMVEHAALAAQAAVLLAWDNPNADAFCTLRLGERGMAYGAFDAVIDCRAIIERAMPQG
ncbi:MAG TPA: DNA alkylation response protein, partial [Novosphingobium sp.]|nr:DNA alkylation response protein [Novosphingobium sp.]